MNRHARSAALVAAMAVPLTVGPWASRPVPVSPEAPGVSAEVKGSETLAELIQRTSDRSGAQPAEPGRRPGFIPAAVLVVQGQAVVRVSLDTALAGRSGSVVAWIPGPSDRR